MSDDLVALLRKTFRYEPDTGLLFRRENEGTHLAYSAGQEAGALNDKGYIYLCFFGHRISAHRAIWAIVHGIVPTVEIDHRDRIRNNNRLLNLREATPAQNSWNAVRRSRALPKGVSFNSSKRSKNRYRAAIMVNGVRACLGSFSTPELAGSAYAMAALAAFGEFACLETTVSSLHYPYSLDA
jgi:HNH endonuclease